MNYLPIIDNYITRTANDWNCVDESLTARLFYHFYNISSIMLMTTGNYPDSIYSCASINLSHEVINNRQVVHGSFANTGFETRVTVNFGFHKRSSVLNIKGAGIHAEAKIMDSEYINKRSEVIALAINARKKRFPEEKPFNYTPLSDNLDAFDWNESSQAGLKDYNLMDLSI